MEIDGVRHLQVADGFRIHCVNFIFEPPNAVSRISVLAVSSRQRRRDSEWRLCAPIDCPLRLGAVCRQLADVAGTRAARNCAFPISRSNWLAAALADVHGRIPILEKAVGRAKRGARLPTYNLARENDTGRSQADVGKFR